MAKRSRSVRPGQRRPVARRGATSSGAAASGPAGAGSAAGSSAAPRPTGLTEAEAARAAEIEAAIVAEERAATTTQRRARDRARERALASARPGGSLAVEEAAEYAYVERDVRRITITATVLIGALIAIWLALEAAGVGPLG